MTVGLSSFVRKRGCFPSPDSIPPRPHFSPSFCTKTMFTKCVLDYSLGGCCFCTSRLLGCRKALTYVPSPAA